MLSLAATVSSKRISSQLVKVCSEGDFSACRRTISNRPWGMENEGNRENTVGSKSVWKIPGIPILPLVGSWPYLMMNKDWNPRYIHKFQQACFNKYGPIFRLCYPGGGNQVFISDLDDVKKVFHDPSMSMDPQRVGFEAIIQIRMKMLADIFKEAGMTFSTGEEWWRVRSIFDELVLKSENLNFESKLLDEVTLEFCERIRKIRNPYSCEVPPNFMDELVRWAIEGISYFLMGVRQHSVVDDLQSGCSLDKFIMNNVKSHKSWERTEYFPPLWRYVKTKDYKILETTGAVSLRYTTDLITQALAAINEVTASGTILARAAHNPSIGVGDLHSTMHDMLGGGLEVTPQHCSKVLYCLAKFPEEQNKLREEIENKSSSKTAPIIDSELKRIKYLRNFIKESLRYRATSIHTNRKVITPVVLSGYCIPKDWVVSIPLVLLATDERNLKRANEFIPERFSTAKNELFPKQWSYLPFSYGRRQCIGRKVAEMALRNFIVRIVQNFDVQYNHGYLDQHTSSTVRLDGPLNFTFKDRKI